jgi:predicted DNA-binding transcriptional regulator YafY
VEGWSFLAKHGRVLLCIAHDPGVRLRDIAASVGITERSAYGIVADLAAAGYAVKQKDGRRNRYQIQAHMPLPEPTSQQLAIGEVLALLAGATAGRHLTRGNQPEASTTPDVATTESGGVSV